MDVTCSTEQTMMCIEKVFSKIPIYDYPVNIQQLAQVCRLYIMDQYSMTFLGCTVFWIDIALDKFQIAIIGLVPLSL